MLSMILSQPDSNETSFTDLQDVAVVELDVRGCLIAVDPHATLVDEPSSLGAAFRKFHLDERLDHVSRFRNAPLRHRFGHFVLAELAVEVRLGQCSGLLPMQSFHQLPSEPRLCITRLHSEHSLHFAARQPWNRAVALLRQPTPN